MTSVYKLISKFECCGETMATVIIGNKGVSTMPEKDYNWILNKEKRYRK